MKKQRYFLTFIGILIVVVGSIVIAGCARKRDNPPEDCIHSYELYERLEVTCDGDGYETYKCLQCGDTYTETFAAIGHDFKLTSSIDATCVHDGGDVYTCNNCGYNYMETKPATGIHSYAERNRVNATCTEYGSVLYVCNNCESSYTELLDPLDHNYVFMSKTEPKCTEDGEVIYVCNRCSDSYSETLETLGHDIVLAETLAATCVLDGENTYKCSRCAYTFAEEIPATGHAYVKTKEKSPTCIKDGEYIYVCENIDKRTNTPCLHTETVDISALGHNWIITDEVAPTYTSTGHYDSECIRCFQTKTDIISKLEYELALNYYYGFTDTFVTTRVRSQDTEGYSLGKTTYFNSSLLTDPIVFDESLLLQNYCTHSILSIKPTETENDKYFTVDSGFKVQFGFNFLDKTIPEKYSEFLSLFDKDAMLKVVQKKESGYFTVYEVVDLSWSSIQVAKRTDAGTYKILDEIDTVDEWNAFLQGDMRLSDSNNKPFFEKGTYRIMIKSNVAWFMEAPTNGGIYNSKGEKCYPYGLINDQYDYFYVNVSGETYNVLRPDELDESHDMFYQTRFHSAKTQQPFIKSGDTVSIGNAFDLKIDTKLSKWADEYHYGNYRLKGWNMSLSLYDVKTDLYIEMYNFDLLSRISGDGTVFISLPNDYHVQGDCKISISFTLENPENGEETTSTDIYYLSVA